MLIYQQQRIFVQQVIIALEVRELLLHLMELQVDFVTQDISVMELLEQKLFAQLELIILILDSLHACHVLLDIYAIKQDLLLESNVHKGLIAQLVLLEQLT